ncbi:P-loop containing nucleoside triphosphate hydrolase protein [Peniophora sp. CONT]|nr:P-loop containing nucleoside triphosphate hydrolase protein [Peniophora sp. CONT]
MVGRFDLDGACHSPEGWGPVSHLRKFDLTPCFEQGVVLPTLLVILLAAGAVQVGLLRKEPARERKSRKNKWIHRAEELSLVLAIACAISGAEIGHVLDKTVAVTQTTLLEPIALAILPIVARLNRSHARRPSTVILLFWPAYCAYNVIYTRTAIDVGLPQPPIALVLRWATAACGLIAWVLEQFGPEYAEEPDRADQAFPELYKENPIVTASIFDIWFFGWLSPLMRLGAKRPITEADLPSLLEHDEAERLGDNLEQQMKKHGVIISLFRAYGGPYGAAAIIKIIHDVLAFMQPQLLRLFLAYIASYQAYHDTPSSPSIIQGFTIVVLMFIAGITQSIMQHQYFQRCYETGMRVRAGLISTIYRKALLLSNDSRSQSTGDIVNLMSVDATRLQDVCTYGLVAISGPWQITLAFISLYNLLGWSAFVGVAIMLLSIPLNTFVARFLKKMQEQQMKNRDERTRLMSELLSNVRSVKLYAWEHAFLRKILHVRNEKELKLMRKIAIFNSLSSTLWITIPILVGFASFATAAAVYPYPLTSDIIFPALSLFMLLQFPLAMFANVTTNLVEAWVSAKRLSKFFNSSELQPDARQVEIPEVVPEGATVLRIEDGDFAWASDAPTPTLEGISLSVRKGELVGVFGRVGAGKTSLASAIIGDMHRREGTVYVGGTIAYASQNPWVMSATVRDNILFSHEYDETFYNLVLDACALRPDLALMPQGDQTEVGEKGITMSGGQRARLSLARAVYARADLTLLDDVLAAVDSHVARHVFNQVIGPRGILASKARILITNSVAFAQHFDQIVYLRRGIIVEQGPYTKLAGNAEGELFKLIHGHGQAGSSSAGATAAPTPTESVTPPSEDTIAEEEKLDEEKLAEKLQRRGSFMRAKVAALPAPSQSSSASQGLSQEVSQQGRVSKRVYWRYIEAASKYGFAMFIVSMLLQQVCSVLANVSLKTWGEGNRAAGNNSDALGYLWVYGVLSCSSAVLSGASAVFIWVLCSLRSSKNLHDSMLNSVMRAPLTWYELTPSGRIMNLFSRDMYVVDQVLARVISMLFRTIATVSGIVVVITASFPLFLVAIPPLAWFYSKVTTYYLSTSRELQRLNAVSRSPLFSWFSESLNGLSTIRAFGMQSVFEGINARRIDRNQVCYLPTTSVNRWLALRLEFVGASIILFTSSLAMVSLITSSVDAGLVGLVISYALNTTSSLNWLVRAASEVEQNIVSGERMLQYIELEPEAPYEVPETKPEGEWPAEGVVEFRNYSLRYRPELDLVLRDISLKFKPAEKIGICGRTGAGKSSLLLALFRVLEPAGGTIYIDGVDITTIGLHDLRSAISIVPQSPDLFEGTVRENIDPVGEHADADIWVALEQAHLKEFVEGLPGALDAPVQEGGSSLSAGQRQLVCFARALLRKTKILVLDEATSAVDLQTDRAIQDIIRGPQFKDVTLLTIAHRLNTIIDSDRVLVLSDGKVLEFDEPQTLLARPESAFRSLAAEAGLA